MVGEGRERAASNGEKRMGGYGADVLFLAGEFYVMGAGQRMRCLVHLSTTTPSQQDGDENS